MIEYITNKIIKSIRTKNKIKILPIEVSSFIEWTMDKLEIPMLHLVHLCVIIDRINFLIVDITIKNWQVIMHIISYS